MYLTDEQYHSIWCAGYELWRDGDPEERELAHTLSLALWAFGQEGA